ncbi:hypothetical protein [Mesorhizobium sp. M0276]|uniref:hypothetical protein n=1 Tax=Mesorhizobium sp. M0276 TaxID=2956928 RepID=UPI0033379ED2
MKVTDISADIRVGAVNIVGRRASEKGYRRLRRGNEKRREAERVRFLHATSRNYPILLLFRPIQHGCNSQAMVLIFQHFFFNINLVDASAATPLYARIRPFSPRFDLSVHTERTRKNGHYTKLSSGSWRVQVRRKGRYASETFLRTHDAGQPKPSAKSIAVRRRQSPV